MTVAGVRSRVLRVVRGVGSFLKELLEEVAGELVLAFVVCVAVAVVFLVSHEGWKHSPLVTGALGGALLVLLGYGGWELLRPARPGQRGRLAGAAAATFAGAAVLVVQAWPCDCV
ncbi:hypothetical protein ACOT81_26575 [Streptomyces sp. WI04-05B]|uniref:hypothetical protein n=1 Tax=Streptomyces TaxID=1883 RepID=UPI0029A624CD|nr:MULTISPECIES: hypothetical protein [unclassified Streptomyces]MDX2545200.1 hypothetical protein [Streptomyces sp. WI04-05B]MDX2587314.1 hypothetical protein [Streptomyces sp. WI04-05A]MDX3750955.1 hypothetical protein [Streptomyces sp. AK08-02]